MSIRALLGAVLTIAAASSQAQQPVQQVLLLQSLNRGNVVLDRFTGDFRVSLDEFAGKPVNVVEIVVGPTGFIGAPGEAVVDYIRAMYVDRPAPDLIVTAGGPAAVFARQHRDHLFPESPLLFASVDQRFLQGAPLRPNEGAVPVVNDFPGLIDTVLRVLPETKQVFMVIGSGSLGRFWRRELDSGFARFRGRVEFTWSDELSLEDILRRSASLPKDSAIVYLTFGNDAIGGAFADEQVIADLHSRANAPLFGAFTPLFGSGIVGGSLLSISDLARATGDAAARILKGEPAANLRLAPHRPGYAVFDSRELQRWNIPESRLPPASAVHFRSPTLWDEYRPAVLSASTLLLFQSVLIGWLLYERRARRRAEGESRRNLALAADADRRETISALTTSIGHELGQPLSSILHNTQALRRMVGDASSSETAETLDDIETEAALATQIIERHRTMLRSHQIDKKPIDISAVIDDSLALVAHDMRIRYIQTVLRPCAVPCVTLGDEVLLEQVLVNLLRNAMEALAQTPAERRLITIESAIAGAGIEVSVSDTGPGLPADIMGTLFTPFVTTKAHGLGIGLVIAQRIVDAHGGTISGATNAQGGATFTLTLPRVESRAPLGQPA
jgi:signal transduction histidine kinase